MITQPTRAPGAGAPPWEEQRPGYWAKLLILAVFSLLTLAALITGSTLVALLVSPGRQTGNFSDDVLPFLVLATILGVSVFGLVKLYPLVSAPNRFTPSYGHLPPAFSGQPFEVRFLRPWLSRSFRGKGTLRFEANQLVIDGTLEPSPLFQLGIVVVVTLIPLLLLGIGLGLIPALLLGFLIGKKKLLRTMPYTDVRDLIVKGCRLTFSCGDEAPRKVALYVSQIDGERPYRELAQRFPAALGGWMG